MTSRMAYMTSPESWWLLHPDEVYQSMEVAFSEVNGYGFRPYEYLPAPINVTTSVENRTLTSGMYGLRSFMFPYVFAALLYATKLIGIGSSPFMICRLFNVAVTSMLPMSVYLFTNKVFCCRLLAVGACVLSATQIHLVVFGTHALVNSFTAPILFYCLYVCIPTVANVQESHTKRPGSEPYADTCSSGYSSSSSVDQCPTVTGVRKRSRFPSDNNKFPSDTNNNSKQAAVSPARDLGNSSLSRLYCLVASGFLLGLICSVRMDNALQFSVVYASLILTMKSHWKTRLTETIAIAVGCTMAIIVGVCCDMRNYGINVISPLQWFKFNILSGKASKLFSSPMSASYWYEFVSDTFHVCSTCLCIVFFGYVYLGDKVHVKNSTRPYKVISMVVSFVLTLVIYSSVSHKETRFIHNVFVLYSISVALAVHDLVSAISKQLRRMPMKLALLTISVLCAVNTYVGFPSVNNRNTSKWSYGHARDSRDLNICLDVIRRQPNVNGVVIDGDIYDLAGFTVLNHDVALVVKTYHEFYVYSGRRENAFALNERIRILNYIDDVFHESNMYYMFKIMSRDETYNYLLSKRLQTHHSRMYQEMYKCGNYKIYQKNRNSSRTSSRDNPFSVNATIVEYEASWLITHSLYEIAIERLGDVINISMVTKGQGQDTSSDVKGQASVKMYQQLMACYFKLGKVQVSEHVQHACFRKFGQRSCLTPQPKLVLHEEYERFG
ncbi:uncharacterized protein LOC128229786 isoform X2 [Mya arenaria]|nr:uncharacterized protein LOC128229786 isoform X2 [Mya arenaria]XP_052797570.1 uncharacterized protein LOC128229786 isoform X2 [Mya arenaria]